MFRRSLFYTLLVALSVVLYFNPDFNDYSNVNNMIKKLIEVAELLYGETDSLFENDK